MNKLSLIAAAIVLASAGVHAGTTSDTVNVTVNFTAGCTVKTAAAPFAFTYTAFGIAQTQASTTVFQCTRTLTPTFSFDNPGGAQTGAAAVALGTAVTAEGVIKGIRYTLSGATSKSVTGTAAAAGVGGTGGSDGTADEYTVALTAAIAGNQAGDGTTGSGTQTRTLTITY